MWKELIALAFVAFLLIALESGGGRPAWAQVSGTLNQWTATAMIEQLASDEVQASVEFDDNGSGGTRRGGVCLVTDLGLGRCETKEACSEKAVGRGLPGTGTAGWFHYCVAATGDPLACALLTTPPDGTPLYKYVTDTAIKVEGR